MGGPRHPKELRTKVLKMGLAGKTYEQIRAVHPTPKSTLSFWFKRASIPRALDRTRMLEHLARVRPLGRETIMARRRAWIEEARNTGTAEAQKCLLSDVVALKSLLAMLYWAE